MSLFNDKLPPALLLDLTIASQMRPHAALSSRLADLGLRQQVLKTSARRAAEAGVINEIRIPWRRIAGYFGEPDEAAPDHLTYQLTLWPAHKFRFGIHPQGWVSYDGLQLVSPTRVRVPDPISLVEASKLFQPGRDTTAEIGKALGAPKLVQGWERMEDWYYPVRGARDLVLEFDFGLLTGIDQRNPILMSEQQQEERSP